MALGLFVLGLLSKTVTATLPAGAGGDLLVEARAAVLENGRMAVVALFRGGRGGGLFTAWVERKLLGAEGRSSPSRRWIGCLIAGRALWFYLGKLFWPAELIFIYPRWQINPAVWWQYLFPAAAGLLLAVLWALRRRSRAPLAGLLFFGGTLFPALGFFNVYPFRYSFVADHFQYLASLGVIVPVSAGTAWALQRAGPRRVAGRTICLALW